MEDGRPLKQGNRKKKPGFSNENKKLIVLDYIEMVNQVPPIIEMARQLRQIGDHEPAMLKPPCLVLMDRLDRLEMLVRGMHRKRVFEHLLLICPAFRISKAVKTIYGLIQHQRWVVRAHHLGNVPLDVMKGGRKRPIDKSDLIHEAKKSILIDSLSLISWLYLLKFDANVDLPQPDFVFSDAPNIEPDLPAVQPLVWYGSNADLAEIIRGLWEKKLIFTDAKTPTQAFKLAEERFIDRDGKGIKNLRLSQSQRDKTGPGQKFEIRDLWEEKKRKDKK